MVIKPILAWLCLYLVVTGSLAIVFSVLVFVHEMFPAQFPAGALFLINVAISSILILVGFVTLLPLAQYAYTRQAAINPAIARDVVKNPRRASEKRGLSILLAIVGMTTLFGLNPWGSLYISWPLVGIPASTLLMAILLAFLSVGYRKRLRGYI